METKNKTDVITLCLPCSSLQMAWNMYHTTTSPDCHIYADPLHLGRPQQKTRPIQDTIRHIDRGSISRNNYWYEHTYINLIRYDDKLDL